MTSEFPQSCKTPPTMHAVLSRVALQYIPAALVARHDVHIRLDADNALARNGRRNLLSDDLLRGMAKAATRLLPTAATGHSHTARSGAWSETTKSQCFGAPGLYS